MSEFPTHTSLPGQLVLIGCGSIGQAVLPLILRHLDITPDRITIVTADPRGREEASALGITFIEQAITPDNYRRVLEPLVGTGDFILNLSVDVSSTAIVRFAFERGALYLDTVVEPWGGMYFDGSLSPAQRSTTRCVRPCSRCGANSAAAPRPSAPRVPIPASSASW